MTGNPSFMNLITETVVTCRHIFQCFGDSKSNKAAILILGSRNSFLLVFSCQTPFIQFLHSIRGVIFGVLMKKKFSIIIQKSFKINSLN